LQFNRDEAGVMHKLPKPSVDTGMGLERISAVLQGVHSNYGIDLFQALIKAAARETRCTDLDSPSLKVLADHIRACAFLLADGVIAGNEGRGFVLRRIIRRAIRHGWKLGARAPFFHKLVPDLVGEMGEAYPELAAAQTKVMDSLKQEEERFFATIEHGMSILDAELAEMAAHGTKIFNGETAFKLHDTYGFPLDLTADIGREHGVSVDTTAFDKAMARQKEQARAAGKFKMAMQLEYDGAATDFKGYESLDTKAKVLALYRDGSPVNELNEGDLGVVVLDQTPFYAESGGQVGDRGELRGSGLFAVEDTQKIQASVFGHHGVMRTGKLMLGDAISARVDAEARTRTMRNHSATHLMHKALREVLGSHVQQKGSQVDPDKTRFDFAHNQPVTADEIRRVETLVNAEILANAACQARVMSIDDAQKTGAMMLFGEKYGDEVRVLDIGSSRELCGGTHVARTGDIGLFKVVAESGVAAGVRRIEAVTGSGAMAHVQAQEDILREAAERLHSQPADIAGRIAQLQDQARALEKELDRYKAKLAAAQGDELAAKAIDIAGIKLLVAQVEGADAKALRELADKLRDRLVRCALLLASVNEGKVGLIAATTSDIAGKLKAGDLVNFVAAQVGGKGGGKADLAQAGGTEPAKLPQALASVPEWVRNKLI
jgi:alanyl-tRNA synthetase